MHLKGQVCELDMRRRSVAFSLACRKSNGFNNKNASKSTKKKSLTIFWKLLFLEFMNFARKLLRISFSFFARKLLGLSISFLAQKLLFHDLWSFSQKLTSDESIILAWKLLCIYSRSRENVYFFRVCTFLAIFGRFFTDV